AHGGGLGDDVIAGHAGDAAGRPQHRAEDAHGGRLAGAVGAEQAEDLARPRRETDAIDRVDHAAAQVAEGLGEGLDVDHSGQPSARTGNSTALGWWLRADG